MNSSCSASMLFVQIFNGMFRATLHLFACSGCSSWAGGEIVLLVLVVGVVVVAVAVVVVVVVVV